MTIPIMRAHSTEQMISKAEQLLAEDELGVRKMLQQTDETIQTATATLSTLISQSEQIRRCQDDVDRVGDATRAAEREMRSIESISGQILNTVLPSSQAPVMTTAKVAKQLTKEEKKKEKSRQKQEKKLKNEADKQFKKRGSEPQAVYRPREIKVLSLEAQKNQQQIEDGIDELSHRLAALKHQAVAMGDELDRQAPALMALSETTEEQRLRLRRDIETLNAITQKKIG